MSSQILEVAKADALILSSTSVFNNTFLDLINATKSNCDMYTLGPSTILNKEMFQYRQLSAFVHIHHYTIQVKINQ
ncbi:Rossmann-like domain-containing protein [Bacteroidota bacterium]